MTTTNNRYLDITDNIRVGYNYIISKYYIVNKETTTYRTTVKDVQDVLHSLEIYDIQDGVILSFKSSMEDLTDIYFTWSDTGSYIKTLQFNDHKDYALNLDCEKAKLYIMNSTLIFDLNTQESPKIVRVPKLCSFYKDFIGLTISQEDMLILYNFLTSYFNPTCYRQIQPRETMADPLYYNNNILLSNYNKKAHAVYNLRINPRNLSTPVDIASIISIDNNTNSIVLENPIEPSIISEYDIAENSPIIVHGTETLVNDIGYSSDGIYTIDTIHDNTIKVIGTIPVSYSYTYPTCYLLADTLIVTSMSRTDNTITVQEAPNNILIGDTILIKNAIVTTEYEEISCNGTYTVTDIHENTITVQETIPTNFTGNATLEKQIYLSTIKKIENNIIYFIDNVEITLQATTIIMYNNNVSTEHMVLAQDKENNLVVVDSIEDYTPKYPDLQYPSPSTEIMVNITDVDEDKESELPIGEFLLDTPQQAQTYLSNYSWVVVPDSIPDMVSKKHVTSKIPLVLTDKYMTLELLGLYSEVYSEDEK